MGGVTLSGTVANTILHSTQGNLVVGNYDISGPGGILLGANGFIYNIATGQYTLMNVNGSYDNLTSLYGIWQNGVGSNTYTIAGGSKDGNGLNAAFLQTYDASTGEFSNLTFYNGFNKQGSLLTHFENITAVPGGFNLVATTDSGPAMAAITVNSDGSFGEAVWTAIQLPGSTLLTGNIAYQNVVGGIYNTDDSSTVATYLGVVQQSHVNADGGLIMPVGAHEFSYSLSVHGSVGATITGSTTAGNVLGGSIGNDISPAPRAWCWLTRSIPAAAPTRSCWRPAIPRAPASSFSPATASSMLPACSRARRYRRSPAASSMPTTSRSSAGGARRPASSAGRYRMPIPTAAWAPAPART